jgi:Fe-S-cluster containining protein
VSQAHRSSSRSSENGENCFKPAEQPKPLPAQDKEDETTSESIILEMDYRDWLQKEEKKRVSAAKKGEKHCLRCGLCCLRRPCTPTPTELKAIAKFLKLSVKETIKKYFVVDSLDAGNTKFVFPAKTTQLDLTGKYVPWRRTYDKGGCIFFNEKKHACIIWPVRPQTAKTTCCWEPGASTEADRRLEETVRSWKNFNFEKLGIAIREE